MTEFMWQIIIIVVAFNILKLTLKFISKVFKRLGNDNKIDEALDRAEDKMDDAAEKVANYYKKRKKIAAKKRKEKLQPVVTIR